MLNICFGLQEVKTNYTPTTPTVDRSSGICHVCERSEILNPVLLETRCKKQLSEYPVDLPSSDRYRASIGHVVISQRSSDSLAETRPTIELPKDTQIPNLMCLRVSSIRCCRPPRVTGGVPSKDVGMSVSEKASAPHQKAPDRNWPRSRHPDISVPTVL